MFRNLWRWLVRLSMLLAVFFCVLWAWSYRQPVCLYAYKGHYLELQINGGMCRAQHSFSWYSKPMSQFAASPPEQLERWWEPWTCYFGFVNWSTGVFPKTYFQKETTGGAEFPPSYVLSHYSRAVYFPAWYLPILFAIPPVTSMLFAIVRRFRRRRRREQQLCPGCGYDLRASPERCPECGRPRVENEPVAKVPPLTTRIKRGLMLSSLLLLVLAFYFSVEGAYEPRFFRAGWRGEIRLITWQGNFVLAYAPASDRRNYDDSRPNIVYPEQSGFHVDTIGYWRWFPGDLRPQRHSRADWAPRLYTVKWDQDFPYRLTLPAWLVISVLAIFPASAVTRALCRRSQVDRTPK